MGNNSWMNSPFFSRHLVPQNVGNIIFVCYFLNIGLGPTNSQCSRHFSKKSIPGLPYLEPHRKVNATTLKLFATNFFFLQKTAKLFSNLDFLPKSGFPKTLDLSMDFPRIFHGGRRPTKNVGGCGGGGTPPPHEISRPDSLGAGVGWGCVGWICFFERCLSRGSVGKINPKPLP